MYKAESNGYLKLFGACVTVSIGRASIGLCDLFIPELLSRTVKLEQLSLPPWSVLSMTLYIEFAGTLQ